MGESTGTSIENIQEDILFLAQWTQYVILARNFTAICLTLIKNTIIEFENRLENSCLRKKCKITRSSNMSTGICLMRDVNSSMSQLGEAVLSNWLTSCTAKDRVRLCG